MDHIPPNTVSNNTANPNLNRQSGSPNNPYQNPVDPPKKESFPIAVFLVFGVLCLIIGAMGVLIYSLLTNKTETAIIIPPPAPSEQTINKPTEIPVPPTNPPLVSEGTIYYIRNTNIFAYNIATKQTIQLTNNPKNPDISPSYAPDGSEIPNIQILSLSVVGDKNLGYGKCAIVKGDFGCGLYLWDLEKKTEKEIKKLDSNSLLEHVDFVSDNTYAYLANSDTKWQIQAMINNKPRILEDLVNTMGGRGGGIEDSSVLSFNSDGQYLLHISTASPRDIADYNIYIYNITSKTKMTIVEGTHPSWLTNHSIVYRKYKKGLGGEGLFLFDVTNQNNEKIIGIENTAYHPSAIPGSNMLLYETYPDKFIKLYNFQTNTSTVIASSTLYPKWVNRSTFLSSIVSPCDPTMDCMMDYEEKTVGIYDLTTKQKTGEIPELTSSWNVVTKYNP